MANIISAAAYHLGNRGHNCQLKAALTCDPREITFLEPLLQAKRYRHQRLGSRNPGTILILTPR